MKLGIMQPYFFPYIGYYQLVKEVDHFIFYDDVNFIKRGWINRTNIIGRERKQLITISLKQSSQNKLINEIEIADNQYKFLKTIEFTYKKATFFADIFPLIESCFVGSTQLISDISANSIRVVNDYLKLDTEFSTSSKTHNTSSLLKKEKRIIKICQDEEVKTYINPIGGMAIYSKDDFQKEGIEIKFLKSKDINYNQEPILKSGFEPNLSIIDVLMFNDIDTVRNYLNQFELI